MSVDQTGQLSTTPFGDNPLGFGQPDAIPGLTETPPYTGGGPAQFPFPIGTTRTIAIPFSYDTPDLLTGAPLYTPVIGEVLINAWIGTVTAWNGTTSLGDIGKFTSGYKGYYDLAFDVSGTNYFQDMSEANTINAVGMWTDPGVNNPLAVVSIAADLQYIPSPFPTTDPLCVCVSEDGHPVARAAFVAAENIASYPLTITPSTNDEFVFNNGTNKTFTIAGGVYQDPYALAVAIEAATNNAAPHEAFSTHATVGVVANQYQWSLFFRLTSPGTAGNSYYLATGVNDALADIGFATSPENFAHGTDGPTDPGATQGMAYLYLVVAYPIDR